jgi:hypothetical protein
MSVLKRLGVREVLLEKTRRPTTTTKKRNVKKQMRKAKARTQTEPTIDEVQKRR